HCRTGAVPSSNPSPLICTAVVAGEWHSPASQRHISPRHPIHHCVRRGCTKDVWKGFLFAKHSQNFARSFSSFEVHEACLNSSSKNICYLFRWPSAPRIEGLMAQSRTLARRANIVLISPLF